MAKKGEKTVVKQQKVSEKKAMKKIGFDQLQNAVENKQKVFVKSYSLCVGLDERGQQKTKSVFRAFVDKEMFEITFETYKKFKELK